MAVLHVEKLCPYVKPLYLGLNITILSFTQGLVKYLYYLILRL